MKNGKFVFLIRKNKFTKSNFKIRLHNLTSNSKKFPSKEQQVEIIKASFYKNECDLIAKHIFKKL